MTDDDGHAVELDAELSRSRDKQPGFRWPIAVDAKLDRLLQAADAATERTSRKEIVAALVATCDLDGAALGEMIRRYRAMKVRDALPAQPQNASVVRLAERGPGRPTRRPR